MMIVVLALTLCVASASGGLALLAHTERTIANAHLRTVQTAYAAEIAAELAMASVAQAPGSSEWPAAGEVTALTGGARVMAIAAGQTIDLDARTAELNRDAARAWALGANTPRWRLFGWGRVPDLPGDASASAPRVAVWVADDVMDRDGNAGQDANSVLMIRAEAFGLGGAGRAVLTHVVREAGRVRTLSWRDVSFKED